jgi:hypothetical protein
MRENPPLTPSEGGRQKTIKKGCFVSEAAFFGFNNFYLVNLKLTWLAG